MKPHFQPIVELATGRTYGREALMRGKLGAVEVRGGELLAAAEAHDALFSFDYRARTAALEVGLPLLPEGEVLFVNLDPRAALDVESTVRTTWPVVARMNADPSRICIEVIKPERCPDREMLADMVDAHRKRGAKIALDDLSCGTDALLCLDLLRPDIAKIDNMLTQGIQHSDARRRLVGALVELAHEQGAMVVAEGIERIDEYETMLELGRRSRPGLLLRPADRAADGRRRAPVHPPLGRVSANVNCRIEGGTERRGSRGAIQSRTPRLSNPAGLLVHASRAFPTPSAAAGTPASPPSAVDVRPPLGHAQREHEVPRPLAPELEVHLADGR